MKTKYLNRWTVLIAVAVASLFIYMLFTEGEACRGSLNKEAIVVTIAASVLIGVGIGITTDLE